MATATENDLMGRFHYTVIARVSVFIVGGAVDSLFDFFFPGIIVRYVYPFFLRTGGYYRYVLGWIGTTGGFLSFFDR